MSYDFKQHLKVPWYKKPWIFVCSFIAKIKENKRKVSESKKFYLVNRWDFTVNYYSDINDLSTKTSHELFYYRCYENGMGERKIEIDCKRSSTDHAKMTKLYQYLKDWKFGHISTQRMKDAWKRTYADGK